MILIPSVRLAIAADAHVIAGMSREYIEQGLGWSWTCDRVLKAIHERSTNVAVACEEERVLAFGIMQYGESRAHLSLLGVQETHRNRGLATTLLVWLEKCAMVAGIERIQLEARSDNTIALAFYGKQGYRRIGTITGYYQGVLDAVRFEKQLVVPSG